MPFEFKLPDVGEGVIEGEVVKWKVAEGDIVKLDQPMVEVMTDKATVEIPAPRAGRVAKIMVGEGKVCAVGQVLIVIDDTGVAAGSTALPPVPASVPASSSGPHPAGNGKGNGHGKIAPAVTEIAQVKGSRVLATPATRRLARELGVDLSSVTPTGKMGRVTSDDVRGFRAPVLSTGGSDARAPAHAQVPPPQAVSIPTVGAEERVPFRGLRKAIAQNMARSKFTATHFTYVEEVDMTDLVAVRARAKERAAERGFKLSYLPFIVRAAIAGLKKWPSLNSSLDEAKQEIVLKRYYHIGVATQGPQGLSVGVVRDADKRSIFDLAREVERLAEAIRQGKASREDLTGSTFTISSLGQLGGVLATPIINFPEAAIMGVHKIAEKPAVRGGQIVIRHLMNLSISIDHRIADGYDGAMFLQEMKAYLEDPTLMFMEMV
ncbi:MAG: 2-oxo acid dehydrogenase subunit E2 [Deltaproteobacteria bacterium]|nr:2-oxo acid dehydrogenase subunit E2 [Deltaproteobacteria bacterium]